MKKLKQNSGKLEQNTSERKHVAIEKTSLKTDPKTRKRHDVTQCHTCVNEIK